MSTSYSAVPESVVVDRLRAAGCVFAEDEARLLMSAARTPAELDAMVARRVAGLPLEYIVGWAEFRGLRFAVDSGVFVPRRRTEFLVECAAARATPGAVIVDLGCGSGALGAALAAIVPGVELYAADIDPVAVRCARRNVAAAGGQVFLGDLYNPLPPRLRGRVDVLLANMPYVPSEEIELLPAEARMHEARMALDGGPDGLDMVRRTAVDAPRWLAPGGHLLVETSERQAAPAAGIFAASGLTPTVLTSAESFATVLCGTRSLG